MYITQGRTETPRKVLGPQRTVACHRWHPTFGVPFLTLVLCAHILCLILGLRIQQRDGGNEVGSREDLKDILPHRRGGALQGRSLVSLFCSSPERERNLLG